MRKYHVYGNLDDVFLQAWNVHTYLHFLLFFHAACKASRLSTLSDTNVPKRFSVRGCSLKKTHNIYERARERETDTHIKSIDSLIHSNKCVQTFDFYCLYHTYALIHKIIYADCALTWPKSSAWLQGLSVNMYCIAAIWDTPIACNPEVNHQFLHVINMCITVKPTDSKQAYLSFQQELGKQFVSLKAFRMIHLNGRKLPSNSDYKYRCTEFIKLGEKNGMLHLSIPRGKGQTGAKNMREDGGGLQKVLCCWHFTLPLTGQYHGAGLCSGPLKWQYWGRSFGIQSACTAHTPISNIM